jgi:hypothetical protein
VEEDADDVRVVALLMMKGLMVLFSILVKMTYLDCCHQFTSMLWQQRRY